MGVLILLSTYNGADFLAEQIASIRAQTYPDWRLLARDDGSDDDTPDLLRRLAQQDQRIRLVQDDLGNLGPAGGFARLMALALSEPEAAIAFADQDDVWHPDKLARQLEALGGQAPDTPVLVHSDLALVDDRGQAQGATFRQRQHLRQAQSAPLRTLLVQNHVVGCSMLINRPLLRLATPVPRRAHMHDWWIALCAAAVGVVHYLPDALVDYRQHGGQRIGARGLAGLARRPVDWLRKMARIYATAFAQAAALRQRLSGRLDERPPPAATESRQAATTRTLERFLALADRPGPARSLGLLRMGIRCRHPALTTLLYSQALLLRPRTGADAREAR